MSIVNGNKITTLMVSAANGDTYGDAERQLFRGVQALVMPNIINQTLSAPPGGPTFGDMYIVATGGSAAWNGHDHQIACWAVDAQDGVVNAGAWEFYTPVHGWLVYDQANAAFYSYIGTAWEKLANVNTQKVAVSPAINVVTINPAGGNSFRVNVNAAVTTVTFSNGTGDGQEITVLWVQDVSGHAVSGFGANIHGATTPSAGANAVTCQRFTWDSTLTIWYATSAGATGM